MKATKKKVLPQLSTKDAEKLATLFSAAKDRFKISDLFFCFVQTLDRSERAQLVEAIIANDVIADDITEAVKGELQNSGYTMLNVQTLDKQAALDEFLNAVLFPHYNEQQQNILF